MHDPQLDLTPLFRRAFEVLDGTDPDSDTAVHIRAHVARLAQQVGLAGAFGRSLDDAIATEAKLILERASPETRQLNESNQTAKQRLLDGDVPGAEET